MFPLISFYVSRIGPLPVMKTDGFFLLPIFRCISPNVTKVFGRICVILCGMCVRFSKQSSIAAILTSCAILYSGQAFVSCTVVL